MATPSLHLRPDLQIQEFADRQGKRRYRLSHPVSGERFELGEEELFLCQQLDLTDDAAVIQTAFAQRFKLTVTPAQLAQFYQQMAALGLLEAVEPAVSVEDEDEEEAEFSTAAGRPKAASRRAERQAQRQRNRWSLCNPQRALTFLASLLAPFRWLVWGLIPGVPLVLLILLRHQPDYLRELEAVGSFGFHILIKLTVGLFCINLLGSLLQGVVCVHYGRPVEVFGIRLAFGVVPHFFVNRPLHGLPRRERLWIIATPLLVRLSFLILGILVWRLAHHAPSQLGWYGFVFGHLALIQTLFTLNPLWRATGYAWLTTYLEFPHLRERAFTVLRLALRHTHPLRALSAREKYALLAYGVAMLAYTLLVFGAILFAAAIYLETQFRGVGVLLFLAVVALFAARMLRRLQPLLIPGKTTRLALRPRLQTDARPEPFQTALLTVKPAPTSGWIGWRRLVLIAVIVGVSLLPYPYAVTGSAVLLPSQRAEVHAIAPGVVRTVQAQDHQRLEPGAVMATVSDEKLRYELAVLRAELEKTQNELDLLLKGPKPEAIAYARQQVALAKIKAVESKKLQELLYPFLKQGVVKGLQYQQSVRDAEVDQAALAVAEANLALVQSPPQPQEVAMKQAELQQLREKLAYLEQQLEATQLRASLTGHIVTPNLGFKQGSFLKEGDLFATLEDTRQIQVEVRVPETEIGAVRLDALVKLRVWAYPLRDFIGKVHLITDIAEPLPENPGVRVVRVVTRIDNADGLLKAQMTGYAKIAAGEEPVIVAFTQALVRFVMLEMWSWTP
ncbi:MAG: efflux RND transporter periplasmic adaptor subunit [Gammaproteobacteria bacterium]|nr:efflux RND transporter periplasmic adaptor subunit [Gammaproteobacteria bacterium]MCP5195225.1 efflux RND transporter periplasmic adaptor subunit [Gammaproteobacteria bacterium]